MNATTYPATVRDLFEMADAQGVTPSELMPPEGFVQAEDAFNPDLLADYFDGPSEAGDGWRIETTFTVDRGVTFELLAPDLSVITMLTTSQALAAGNALARLATKYA
ncbi:hypothetical protein [Arthrobacter sp. H5]|uniref:hypothetical protein n=1 Tax=Arthrobacter sp. H5 TaxID=1267973 RepID=UPI00048627B2|nr:hypothetical protein [Arthrobacter sp. H5]